MIKIPRKWYYDIDEHGSINNKVIGFHKLSPLRDDLFKSIEKQLIVNKGKMVQLILQNYIFTII